MRKSAQKRDARASRATPERARVMVVAPPCADGARARDRAAWARFDAAVGARDGGADGAGAREATRVSDAAAAARLRALGYVVVEDAVAREEDVERGRRLARRARALRDAGADPTWTLVSDDAWALLKSARMRLEGGVFGSLRMNYDALCWVVDPTTDARTSAFCPHRDRQPEDSPGSFRADGTAKYVTAWIPLGYDATTRNSCLYCIPRPQDPGYYVGDDDDGDDPMRVALSTKASYQHIRALPCKVGGAVCFTHRLIHWGSVGEGEPGEPRINISCGFADDSYEPAYLKERPDFPTFEERLALIAGQLICYHERFPSTSKELAMLKSLFDDAKSSFDEAYIRKVYKEFAAAAFEAHSDSDDEDAIEGALDAMLEQADDFEDDFDDFEDGVHGDAFGRAHESDSEGRDASKRVKR